MIVQRTPEWYKARRSRLTASAFGAACGLGPQSRADVWREKVLGTRIPTNEAMQWGIDNEHLAIENLKVYAPALFDWHDGSASVVDCEFLEAGFITHPLHDWLGASADGFLQVNFQSRTGVRWSSRLYVEVKCPYSQEIYPEIPPYYMAQMQGGMEISGTQLALFIVWTPEKVSFEWVPRVWGYWDWMLPRLADLWMYVQAGIEPPRLKRGHLKADPPPEQTVKVQPKVFSNLFFNE